MRNKRRPLRGLALLIALILGSAGAQVALGQEGSGALLTLEEAASLAVRHAPDVQDARRALEGAELNLATAELAFKPSVTASGSVAATEGGQGVRAGLSGSGAIVPGATWNVSLSQSQQSGSVGLQGFGGGASTSLSVNVTVWPPAKDGGTWVTVQNRSFEAAMAARRLELAERNAQVAAVQAYVRLRIARERLALAEEGVSVAADLLDRRRARFAEGLASETDVIRAEIDLLEQQGALETQRQSVAALTADLADLIGRTSDEVRAVTLAPFTHQTMAGLAAWELPPIEEAKAQAHAASVTLTVQQRSLDEARRSLAALRRSGGPSVSVGGSLGGRPGDALGWSVRIDGSYDLWDSGAQANRIKAAERDVEAALRSLRAAESALEQEVEAAYREIEARARALEIARSTAQLRQRELEIGIQQVNRGLLTVDDVVQIERAATSSALDLESAIMAYNVAIMQLRSLIGLSPM